MSMRTVPEDYDQFDATLSLVDPMKDYEKLINEKLRINACVNNEMLRNIWNKISVGASVAIWKMLFNTNNATNDQLEKASIFLRRYKDDACFYSPWGYNSWIVTVRDELLKRQMFDFWKNVIVAQELGPAWVRDSDLFEDSDDPEPANFYKFAGCEAPWLKEEAEKPTATRSSESPRSYKKLTIENALEDYKNNMMAQKDIDLHDKDAYSKIFAEVREILWQLLFSKPSLSVETSKIAAELLEEYKKDACLFSPYPYNDWIPTVRDELFKRKYFDFWNIIVNKRLGLCCVKDSDYFDDMEDPKPMEFYKSGDELMKQRKN